MTLLRVVSILTAVAFILLFLKWPLLKLLYEDYRNGVSSKFMILILMGAGCILLFVPVVITQFSIIQLKYTNTGEIGDIIGGTTSPFIGFIGVIVTFYAFWVQYQSNLNQRNDIQLERFENQYYEMLRLHKENVQEMEIDNMVNGRKCFVRMFEEFKFVYLECESVIESGIPKDDLSKDLLCEIAYKIFLQGLSSISPDQLKILNNDKHKTLLAAIHDRLSETERLYSRQSNEPKPITVTKYVNTARSSYELEMFFYPFDGHNVRLGHYYRHLFQTVSFIADSTLLPNIDSKYKYLKLLRAQLSNHEQALLYYNGLSSYGKKWLTNGYFDEYRMIKNIPFNLADFGKLPEDKFGKVNKQGKHIFEWSA